MSYARVVIVAALAVLCVPSLGHGEFILRAEDKIEPDLAGAVAAQGPDESIVVGIWLRQTYDPNTLLLEREPVETEEQRQQIRLDAQQLIAGTEAPLLDWLGAQGLPVIYACRYAPLVFTMAKSAPVMEVAGRADVDYVYLSRDHYEDQMEHAEKTVRADVVWARGRSGDTLFANHVVVVEDDRPGTEGAPLEFENPYLKHLDPSGRIFNPAGSVDEHVTSTHGIIAAHQANDRIRGVAWGIRQILTANAHSYADHHIIEATEWALDEGGDIFNCSWGGDTDQVIDAIARYYDYISRVLYATVVCAAGNDGAASDVVSPAIGYNVIAVGSFNSFETNRWDDDDMTPSSSSLPNAGGGGAGREKPELVAVGEDDDGGTRQITRLLDAAPWFGERVRGTSFAAPAVSATCLLMAERDVSLLTYPLVMKAILMASACHNIEGLERVSFRDGAGGLVVCEADEVVSNGQFHHANLIESALDPHYAHTIRLQADRTARVVLTWFNNPSRELITDTSTALTATRLTDGTGPPFGPADSKIGWFLQPNTDTTLTYVVTDNDVDWVEVAAGEDLTKGAVVGDTYALFRFPDAPLVTNLDMRIWDVAGGAYVWDGPNYIDNNFEIARFTPPRTGDYEVRIFETAWGPTVEKIGLAWTQEPCCSPDFGDAPDDMLNCARPNRGDFPTLEISDGARTTEYEVEWLSRDDSTSAGATWEMDAYVHPYEKEKDQDGVNNINIPLCAPNQDKEDDGVVPDYAYLPETRGSITIYVNSATPDIGRYSDERPDEKIYVSAWFDWEPDDVTWSQPINYILHWSGGPGMVGTMDKGDCIAGCDRWNPSVHQKVVTAEFDVPPLATVEPFWIRVRLDYGEDVNTETGEATYGEVEDYVRWLLRARLTGFAATESVDGVLVTWSYQLLGGDKAGFNLYRSVDKSGDYQLLNADGLLAGESPFEYLDSEVGPGQTYWYKLGVMDLHGNEETYGPVSTSVSAAGPRYELLGCYPNPAKESTTISYRMRIAGPVEISIYDSKGRLVRELVDRVEGAGTHEVLWDGRDSAGRAVAAGTYYYKLRIGGWENSKKITFVR